MESNINSNTSLRTASLKPSEMVPERLSEMTLCQVIGIGGTNFDRPHGHIGNSDDPDLCWVSVRARVLGFAHENGRLMGIHDIRQAALIQRLEGKHGLAIIEDDPRIHGVQAEYQGLSDLVNIDRSDKAVEILEAEGRVRYVHGGGTSKVTRLSCFRWVVGINGTPSDN